MEKYPNLNFRNRVLAVACCRSLHQPPDFRYGYPKALTGATFGNLQPGLRVMIDTVRDRIFQMNGNHRVAALKKSRAPHHNESCFLADQAEPPDQ